MRFWFKVLAGVWRLTSERHLGLISAGVAFFALLAVFPAAAALIALWGFWSDPVIIEQQINMLSEFIPEEGFDILSSQVDRLIATHDSTLGWATLLSTLIALWSARLGVAAIVQGLNAIYGAKPRGGFSNLFAAILLTFVLTGVVIVALVVVLVLPIIVAFIPLGPLASWVLATAKWLLAIAVVMLGVSLLYRFGPNRKAGGRTPWISPGLLVAVTVWALASLALSEFIANFGNYNEVYGSIGAVIALMFWFYLSAYVVLLGGVLNSELERLQSERKRDSPTEAAPAPGDVQ